MASATLDLVLAIRRRVPHGRLQEPPLYKSFKIDSGILNGGGSANRDLSVMRATS